MVSEMDGQPQAESLEDEVADCPPAVKMLVGSVASSALGGEDAQETEPGPDEMSGEQPGATA